jgi:chloramphenicol-sensitive protein RarD
VSVRRGVAYAAAGYGIWGLFPIYFKAVAAVPALEVLAHRVVWSAVFLAALTTVRGRWPAVAAALRDVRLARRLALSAFVIACNWGLFIWAVADGQILAASLGYYINPLVSVLLGVAVLTERLSPMQWLAVALAAGGVGLHAAGAGTLPWVSLALAVSFAAYGLLRKTTAVDPVTGLFIEALLLMPLAAVALLGFALLEPDGAGARDGRALGLLALSGPLTALPLILFVAGARRIRLATLGLLQYITPTGHFALAVLVYGEALRTSGLVTFACIWAALALYTVTALRRGS